MTHRLGLASLATTLLIVSTPQARAIPIIDVTFPDTELTSDAMLPVTGSIIVGRTAQPGFFDMAQYTLSLEIDPQLGATGTTGVFDLRFLFDPPNSPGSELLDGSGPLPGVFHDGDHRCRARAGDSAARGDVSDGPVPVESTARHRLSFEQAGHISSCPI